MPISVLFIIISTIYFLTNFDFSEALRLGIVAGALSSIAFCIVVSLVILIIRAVRIKKSKAKAMKFDIQDNTSFVPTNPTIYEKKSQTMQGFSGKQLTTDLSTLDIIKEKIMLLMDKEMVYEVSLNAIRNKNIGDIVHQDKEIGSILLRNNSEEIIINISSLTRHTSEVSISSTLDNNNIQNIISLLKDKEYTFIKY